MSYLTTPIHSTEVLPYCTTLHHTMTIPHHTATIPHHTIITPITIQRHTITIPRHAVPCHTMLHHTIIITGHATPHHYHYTIPCHTNTKTYHTNTIPHQFNTKSHHTNTIPYHTNFRTALIPYHTNTITMPYYAIQSSRFLLKEINDGLLGMYESFTSNRCRWDFRVSRGTVRSIDALRVKFTSPPATSDSFFFLRIIFKNKSRNKWI